MPQFDRRDELPVDPDSESLRAGVPFHFTPRLLLAVSIGAACGATARFGISRAWASSSGTFPSATLLINLAGAFALGLLLEGLARRGDDSGGRRVLRLVLGTGFCGAFTTYSALAVQIDLLVRADRGAVALWYAVASVLGGLLSCSSGIALASARHRRSDDDLVASSTGARQQ